MNRKNLTAAVLAGLAGAVGIVGSAQAVNINPDGLGQVLLYPYYTTNGGNSTVLSVVNTTNDAKAVKVRFLEGENSREVLDFNLYMSAYDVWTAAVIDDNGTPTMITTDTSCTVPYIYGNGGVQEFLPWALDDAAYNDKPYGSSKPSGVYDDISRGAEGHFEMIEMGTLVDGLVNNPKWVDKDTYPICNQEIAPGHPANCAPPELPRNWTSSELAEKQYLVDEGSATAATHKAGMPQDCQQLVDAWTVGATSKTDGYWITDPTVDIEAPSGGLFGGASVVDVSNGAMYSYDAKAIDGFYTAGGTYVGDELHQEPGTILPSLDSGNTNTGTVFLDGAAYASGTEGTALERSVDAVSFVLMHDAVMNEYTTEALIGASTEWVITFPTKKFYVYQDYLDNYADFRGNPGAPSPYYDEDALGNFIPVAPFTTSWEWVQTVYYTTGDNKGEVKTPGYVDYPCEVVQLETIWNREEASPVDPDAPPGTPIPPIVSPAPPPTDVPDPDAIIPFELCYETSVIAFGEADEASIDSATSILGSTRFHNINNEALGFDNGWARLNLWNATWDADASGSVDPDEIVFRDQLGGLNGLPVTGFAVSKFINAYVGDDANVLANYGGIFQHKASRKVGSGIGSGS